MKSEQCAFLFSGGTDSTCGAALCAEQFEHVHLLTFFEEATKASPIPRDNLIRLRKHFGENKFTLHVFPTDRLVRELSYGKYFDMLQKHGFFMLSTPGFSSLSWHLRTLKFCLDHRISYAQDGMTRELMHLPGHMTVFRRLITDFYARFGVDFRSQVIDWAVPEDQRYLDRLIVDRHGFVASPELIPAVRTTGKYLYEKGIFPHPNVKGSLFDHRMQHDCYPFVVFNIFVFWIYLAFHAFGDYEHRIESLVRDLLERAKDWFSEQNQLFESESEQC